LEDSPRGKGSSPVSKEVNEWRTSLDWGPTLEGVRSIGEVPYHTEINLENLEISLPKNTGISNFLEKDHTVSTPLLANFTSV
jgi:hypothetical protein